MKTLMATVCCTAKAQAISPVGYMYQLTVLEQLRSRNLHQSLYPKRLLKLSETKTHTGEPFSNLVLLLSNA